MAKSTELLYPNPTLAKTKEVAQQHGPFALSVLINVLLLFILAAPWLWALFFAGSLEAPGPYLEATWHSIRSREVASWDQLTGDASAKNAPNKSVNEALDRIATALKKPSLSKKNIQQAQGDQTAAGRDVSHEMLREVKPASFTPPTDARDRGFSTAKSAPLSVAPSRE